MEKTEEPNFKITTDIPEGMRRVEVRWIPPDWWADHADPTRYDGSCSRCGASPREIIGGTKCKGSEE